MASIHKRHGARGTAYRVQYRDALGRQAVKTFHRLEEARSFRATVEAHRPDDVVAAKIPLSQVAEEHLRRHEYTGNSLRQFGVYRRTIEKSYAGFFDIPVGKISGAMCDRAIMGIQAPSMRKRCRTYLNQLLTFAQKRRYLDRAPMLPNTKDMTRASKMSRVKKSERPLETSEVEAILAAIPDRYRTMVTVMAYVGLRPGEAYGLQVQDFDPQSNTLTIQRAVSRGKVGPTKTGEHRTLPIGGLGDLVQGHIETLDVTSEPSTHLFTNQQGRVLHENTFVPLFKRAVKAAGIPNNVSPNSLRHHAAAWMIRRGANVLQVSRMLGHARPSITLDVYAYLFSDSLDAVAKILPSSVERLSLEG